MANKSMLHVSDFTHLDRCPRLAWLCRNEVRAYHPPYSMPVSFSSCWMQRLNLEDAPSTHVGDSSQVTLDLLKDHEAVLQARLEYKDLRIRIPALVKQEDGSYIAYYPHMTIRPMESEALLIKINELVAASHGLNISASYMISFHKDYERGSCLDVTQLLDVHDGLYARNGRGPKKIGDLTARLHPDLDALIEKAQALLAEEPEAVLSRSCLAKKRCPYYDVCFDDTSRPDDDLLFLTTSTRKFQAIEQNLTRMQELSPDMLDGVALQYAQYQASKNQGCWMDLPAMEAWLAGIEGPVSYLDFEWDTFSIPPYEGMRPFEVVCFQYSLHYEKPDGQLVHTDFFGTEDCRRDFIESLLQAIPEQGSILVYNMEGGEKLRLLQLARQFPEYETRLLSLCERMVDLAKPFEQGIFYDLKQRGHYSLKAVLPVFSHESYKNLNVHDGLEAVQAYRSFAKKDPQAQAEIRENIRNYCAMDTYAEYLIYHGLLEMAGKE